MKRLAMLLIVLLVCLSAAAVALAAEDAPAAGSLYWTVAAVAFAAASEIIGMLPIRSNSVVQVALTLGRALFASIRPAKKG